MPSAITPMIGVQAGGRTNITATTSATNNAPSRNITEVIRTVRPESEVKRVRAMYPVSTRDQTVAAEHVANLRQRGVSHGQDQVARLERVGLVLCPCRAYAVEQRCQGGVELLLVARLDGGLNERVEAVQRRDRVVGKVVLPLTEDPDDHFWSPEDSVVSGSASKISPPSAPASIASGALLALSLASSVSTSDCELIASSSRLMSSPRLSELASSSAPEAISSSIAPARACI